MITFKPLSLDTTRDYETLTCNEGGGGCYCAFWHQKFASHAAWMEQCKAQPMRNRDAVLERMRAGFHVGVVAYDQATPVAWISVGPLPEFYWAWKRVAVLGASAATTAGIVCFTMAPNQRRQKLSVPVLEGLVGYARDVGWGALEGYPFDRAAIEKHGDTVLWPGHLDTFAGAGFVRTENHWIESADYPRSIWRKVVPHRDSSVDVA